MALARIITRSNPCSQQLALDLLGRGYAVEIVSPDSIPDNLADLELRVEEDPGNQLVASVEAHDGGRSASLEFMHRLKAPMADFIRRPPQGGEAVRLPKQSVSIHVEQSVGELELPAVALQAAPETVSPVADILPDSKPVPDPELEKGARLILPRDPLPSLPSDPPGHVALAPAMISETTSPPATADPIAARPVTDRVTDRPVTDLAVTDRLVTDRPVIDHPVIDHPVTSVPMTGLPRDVRLAWEWHRFDCFTGAFRNVVLPLASLALIMALLFGFGTRRSGKTPVQISRAAQVASLPRASIVQKISAMPVSPAVASAGGHPANAPKESPVAKIDNPMAKAPADAPANAPTAAVGKGVSRRHGDVSIARDTVTYFDQHASEAAARATTSQSSAQRPVSRQQDGVVAANTVTLSNNPAPKSAKPDSGIKRYSDLK